MSVVVDASVVVAALVDDDVLGSWALELLRGGNLLAPHLLPVEVMNALRRLVSTGQVSPTVATRGVATLGALTVEPVALAPFADRIWALRDNLSSYDAWYVAAAEAFDLPLATLDHRLVRSVGPRCSFLTR